MANEEALLIKRSDQWRQLEEYCRRIESGKNKLNDAEFLDFVRLYRRASADLAYAGAEISNPDLVNWLNATVGRAYAILYRRPIGRFQEVILNMLFEGADVFRRCWKPIAFSTILFFVSAFLAPAIYIHFPETREVLISPEMSQLFDHWKSGQHTDKDMEMSTMATTGYAINNPRVALIYNSLSAFSFGLFGIYALWLNGAMVGLLGMEMNSVGKLGFLLSSIAPHGVSEIGGIFVACGAGFVLAGALLNPGRRSRALALKDAGKDAFKLLILSLIMILIAAPIEGFFSFSPAIPQWLKTVAAVIALAGWLAYFLGYQKERSVREALVRDELANKLPEYRLRQVAR